MTLDNIAMFGMIFGAICFIIFIPKFIRSIRQMDKDLQNISKALEKYVKEK